jgi:hypothetical protein
MRGFARALNSGLFSTIDALVGARIGVGSSFVARDKNHGGSYRE